jgi:hypothetical protein
MRLLPVGAEASLLKVNVSPRRLRRVRSINMSRPLTIALLRALLTLKRLSKRRADRLMSRELMLVR